MNNSPRFITLHPMPIIDPGFLNRDVGQIGQTLKNELGFKIEVWWLPVPWKEVNFKLEDQTWRAFKNKWSLYKELWQESQTISVLHLYHIWHFTLLGAIIFKFRNPKWKVYIKLDCPYLWKYDIFFIFMRLVLIFTDWVWVEDPRYITFFTNKYSFFRKKFIFTPSGAIDLNMDKIQDLNKEKRIALVGRFGDSIKNYELFLDILETRDIEFLADYDVFFVWAYTDIFWERIKKIQTKIAQIWWPNIVMVWFLQKKEDLYDILLGANLFLHTSNHEGDPNIQYDAMYCGCYMLSTDVWNIKENYPSYASSFYPVKDADKLYALMKELIWGDKLKSFNPTKVRKYCLEKFTWNKSLLPLISNLKQWKK